MERVTFSPGEFAALFGKSQTWGYRQIYAGRVNAITEFGRILIPAKEVERILETASRYEGQVKRRRSKTELPVSDSELKSAWQAFVERKKAGRISKSENADATGSETAKAGSGGRAARRAALERLRKR